MPSEDTNTNQNYSKIFISFCVIIFVLLTSVIYFYTGPLPKEEASKKTPIPTVKIQPTISEQLKAMIEIDPDNLQYVLSKFCGSEDTSVKDWGTEKIDITNLPIKITSLNSNSKLSCTKEYGFIWIINGDSTIYISDKNSVQPQHPGVSYFGYTGDTIKSINNVSFSFYLDSINGQWYGTDIPLILRGVKELKTSKGSSIYITYDQLAVEGYDWRFVNLMNKYYEPAGRNFSTDQGRVKIGDPSSEIKITFFKNFTNPAGTEGKAIIEIFKVLNSFQNK